MDPPSPPPLNEQTRRARAAIASSRENIARSWVRISESKLLLKRPREDFDLSGVELTDVQRGAWLEWQQAVAEQHEIEIEVGRTLDERDRDEAD